MVTVLWDYSFLSTVLTSKIFWKPKLFLYVWHKLIFSQNLFWTIVFISCIDRFHCRNIVANVWLQCAAPDFSVPFQPSQWCYKLCGVYTVTHQKSPDILNSKTCLIARTLEKELWTCINLHLPLNRNYLLSSLRWGFSKMLVNFFCFFYL